MKLMRQFLTAHLQEARTHGVMNPLTGPDNNGNMLVVPFAHKIYRIDVAYIYKYIYVEFPTKSNDTMGGQ